MGKMALSSRLLGLAFASADTLVEIDGEDRVVLAMGAAPAVGHAPEDAWTNRPLIDLFEPRSAERLKAALEILTPGARSEPLDLLYSLGRGAYRRVRLRLFSLPELAPHCSCALTWLGQSFELDTPEDKPLLSRDALMRQTGSLLAAQTSDPLSLAFIDVAGMDQVEGDQLNSLTARLHSALQSISIDGASASHLAGNAYALLRHESDTASIEEAIHNVAALEGVEVSADVRQVELTPGVDRQATLRAMRHALEVCITNGAQDDPDVTFKKTLDRTLVQMDSFRAMVKARDFALHYQPIVDLDSGAVHHFEALARIPGSDGPESTIRLAETLALIDSFDLAVAEKAIQLMRRPGFGLTNVAINVSAGALDSDAYGQALLRLSAGDPDIRRRLSLEITETANITDLAAAQARLLRIRQAGFKVYLDDFGVGASCFDYLNHLTVDGVKIDGTFVMRATEDEKARTLIRHLVDMCGGLELKTVAERVETGEVAELMLKLGVKLGQGWFFGRPEPQPRLERPTLAATGRRRGAVESWG
jgi:EAL domain-containing protein (putative c-di-GMP-specific phosphodiesterase class I)